MRTTILSVIGTRPEAVKMAPILGELARHGGQVRSLTCVTGQHRELLDPVLALFDIRPDYDLNVMRAEQPLAKLTGALLEGLDCVIRDSRPDWVLAQGDTTTVLAASLVAYYQRRRFGHVEAGLRTGDKFRPFPEELNRRIADLAADAYFAPTSRARECLVREGCEASRIHVTGNTVIDALRDIAARPFDWAGSRFARLAKGGRFVLVTAHRRENFGRPLREMCEAIRQLASTYTAAGVHFIYPVHLNPEVNQPVRELLAGVENLTLVEPLDYFTMVHLMKRASLMLTDSGGLQEEACGLGLPVLVMRDTTERPEGVEAGLARLVGTTRERIVAETKQILDARSDETSRSLGSNPYGDGRAASRIVSVLLNGGMKSED
jgi:UDP-N-acetylglucosamine 2-epimerase